MMRRDFTEMKFTMGMDGWMAECAMMDWRQWWWICCLVAEQVCVLGHAHQ